MPFANAEGKTVPDVKFPVITKEGFKAVSTDDLFKGKRVVVFSLPGAFTPTCSSTHLPRYNELAEVIKAQKVDDIICMSVNDTFVMNEWRRFQEAENITLIPDGNCEFTEKIGMMTDKSAIGFGKRSWRYSMVVNDKVVEKMFIEPEVEGDPFEVSDADTMLKYLNPNAQPPKFFTVFSRPGCPYCANTIALMKSKGCKYEEITLGKDITSKSLTAVSGASTTPQVFYNGNLIGDSVKFAEFAKTL